MTLRIDHHEVIRVASGIGKSTLLYEIISLRIDHHEVIRVVSGIGKSTLYRMIYHSGIDIKPHMLHK